MKHLPVLLLTSAAAIAAPSAPAWVAQVDPDRLGRDAAWLRGASETQVAEVLLKQARSRVPLYLRVGREDAPALRQRFPEAVRDSLAVADQVRQQSFLFRYDWDMEKTQVPHVFPGAIDWTAIPAGDEEWCYMLNRHRYWIDLGRSYLLTGDERHARTWVAQVSDWIARNPVSDPRLKRLSWRRIEAGIRCENWIRAFECFRNSPAVTPAFFARFLGSLHDHATFLSGSFSDFSRTSNWGVLEFHGLLNAACFLKDFRPAEAWRREALARLETCASLQVLPDGTQWEQSPMYHNEVFHCLMNTVLLARREGLALSPALEAKARAMAWANVAWQKPNGHQPLLGDSDDTDLRGLLTTAAALFGNATLKHRAHPELDYESLFTFGFAQAEAYQALKPEAPPFTSLLQPSVGDFYMRSGWGPEAAYASFHMKKLGCGHAHDDLLHLSLYARGRDVLVDGGRYTYVDGPWRKRLKGSTSHNGLEVDGEPNAIYGSSWENHFRPHAQGLWTRTAPDFDYAEATSLAYLRLPDPVLATRRVLYLKPDLWLLFDRFAGRGSHRYTQSFLFPDARVEVVGGAVRTTHGRDDLVLTSVKPATAAVEATSWSPEYNLLKEGRRVTLSRQATGPDSFITVLAFPGREVAVVQVPVADRTGSLLPEAVAEAVAVRYGGREFLVLVVNDTQGPRFPFYRVQDQWLTGEVVVLEKQGGTYVPLLVKE